METKIKLTLIGCFLVLISVSSSFGQASIVTAPILEGQAATANTILAQQSAFQQSMNALMASLESAEAKYKKMLEQADWLRDLNTARRLLYLMENLICTTKDMNVRLSLADRSCFYQFSYDMNFIKIEMAADYLGILMASGRSFTAAERMRTLNDVIIAFDQANKEMAKLNATLDRALSTKLALTKNKAAINAVTKKRFSYR